jgi:hypothetical protein
LESGDITGANAVADHDVQVSGGVGNGGGSTVYGLREGIERFMITDINNPAGSAVAPSEIWVAFDSAETNAESFNHVPGGRNVLYMDGYVGFVRYPGDAPVTMDYNQCRSPRDGRRGVHMQNFALMRGIEGTSQRKCSKRSPWITGTEVNT